MLKYALQRQMRWIRFSCLILWWFMCPPQMLGAVSGRVFVEVEPGTWAYKAPISAAISASSLTNTYRQKLGRGAVWVRGSSAQLHPKKAYRLEFQDNNGEDLKT